MPPSEAPVIDAALVRRLIAAQFPQWAELAVTPVEPGGWDNRSFRLGDGLSVRLPSGAAYVAQVEKEHRWLPRLAPHLPLPVPRPLAKGAPGPAYPWPWSVYRWLEGDPATPDRIADLDDFALALAGFLAALYRVDAADGPPAGQHNFHRGGHLAVYDAETRAAIAALRGRIDAAAAEQVWTAALASEWDQAPVWVHGDIAAGNLLVKDGRLGAVIDFGSCAVGDPACDLAIAWTLFTGSSREAFRAGLEQFPIQWAPVERKKLRQNKKLEPRSDAIRTDQALGFGEDTWERARGWALWKALITAAAHDGNQRNADRSWQVIDEVLFSPVF